MNGGDFPLVLLSIIAYYTPIITSFGVWLRIMFYDSTDSISNGIGTEVRTTIGLEETELRGFRAFVSGEIALVDVGQKIIFTDDVVKMFDADLMIFLSRHASADGVKAFTVHPTGNWSDSADYGGTPKTLSVAAPHFMAGMLRDSAPGPPR